MRGVIPGAACPGGSRSGDQRAVVSARGDHEPHRDERTGRVPENWPGRSLVLADLVRGEICRI